MQLLILEQDVAIIIYLTNASFIHCFLSKEYNLEDTENQDSHRKRSKQEASCCLTATDVWSTSTSWLLHPLPTFRKPPWSRPSSPAKITCQQIHSHRHICVINMIKTYIHTNTYIHTQYITVYIYIYICVCVCVRACAHVCVFNKSGYLKHPVHLHTLHSLIMIIS